MHHEHPRPRCRKGILPTHDSRGMYMSELRAPRLLISFHQTIDTGSITIVLDAESEDWHVETRADHDPAMLRTTIAKLSRWGYEPIPEEECEAELMENGNVRIYFYAERGAIIG